MLSNDKPLLVRFNGEFYFPMVRDYPEKVFGGDFETATDYLDPYIQAETDPGRQLGDLCAQPLRPQYAELLRESSPIPAAPSADNLLGTDERGRDLLAQLLYGFRLSVLFGLALTVIGVLIGVLTGAIQGYFGGKTDLAFQRFLEIWGSMPELYLLIIFSAVFSPSVALLLILLSLFGWMGLSDYVRAEFLRNRQMDYVRAARALGVGNGRIMWKHILPNSMTPVVTFLPFRMSAAILALTSLDFLGLGVPPGTPSLGELLSQGKNNIDAWWISLSTFAVLVITLLLLTFMGDALRDALDPRKAEMQVRGPPAAPWRHAAARGQGPARRVRRQGGRPRRRLFDRSPGEKLALVGESGSGKTVTALSLLGLVQNAKVTGSARFAPAEGAQARDLLSLSERELLAIRGQQIAMIFQEPMTALNPLYTVGDQIAEVLQLQEGLTRRRGLARGDRGAGGDGHARARAARRCLSAPALGRPAPAGHDRDGAVGPAAAAAGRRADHGAGRDAAHPDPGPAVGGAAAQRHVHPADHARPEPGAQVRRPGGGDGERPSGGAGDRRRRYSPIRSTPTPASSSTAGRCAMSWKRRPRRSRR